MNYLKIKLRSTRDEIHLELLDRKWRQKWKYKPKQIFVLNSGDACLTGMWTEDRFNKIFQTRLKKSKKSSSKLSDNEPIVSKSTGNFVSESSLSAIFAEFNPNRLFSILSTRYSNKPWSEYFPGSIYFNVYLFYWISISKYFSQFCKSVWVIQWDHQHCIIGRKY